MACAAAASVASRAVSSATLVSALGPFFSYNPAAVLVHAVIFSTLGFLI